VIAVVSWNTRALLLECLASFEPDCAAGRADVWVVDTGSADGSVQAAREQAPWARVIETEGNVGYGAAVNLVARQTTSEWLVCANADTAPDAGALSALLADGAPASVGCVAPRLVLPDGRTQHSVYPFPTLGFTLAFNAGLPALSRGLADRLCLEGRWNPEVARGVPWAIGAFLLIRRRAFDAVGGFDERQWMYAEDLDLGWRLHDAGWVTRYQPAARVRHASGAATARAFGDERTDRFTAETYGVIARRRGRARARATAAINIAGAAARIAWMTPAAIVLRRLMGPRDASRMWLSAHIRGLRAIGGGR
jgi:GT2 family glycosyltransferase